MYTEAIYEYFNGTSSKEPIRKKTGLARCNAFKRKTRKNTVVLQKNPTANVSSRNENNSVSANAHTDGETSTENIPPVPSQQLVPTTTQRTTAGAIYETVLSIWKYTKSFISYNNSDVGSRNQVHLRQDGKNRSRSSYLDSPSSSKTAFCFEKQTQTSSSDICVVVGPEEHPQDPGDPQDPQDLQIPQDPQDSDGNGKGDHSPEDISQKGQQKNTTTQTSIAIPDYENILMIHKPEVFFQKDQKSVCIDTTDENFSITSINEESNEDGGSTLVPTVVLSEFSVPKDLQDEKQPSASPVGTVEEAKKLKSSLKTYGRGKRRSQKLHVSFKEDYMVKSQKLPTFRSCSLNMNHSYYPSLNDSSSKTDPEQKKQTTLDKKGSSANFGGKKRRLTLRTNSSRSSIRKKRQKRCSSNISLVTKTSASKIVSCKRRRSLKKKSSARSATKYLKYKNKKEKNLKNIQKVLEVISDIDNNLEEPVHLSYEDCYQIMKAIDTDESDYDEFICHEDTINPVNKEEPIAALGKLCEKSIAAQEISVESKKDLKEHEVVNDKPSSTIPEDLFEETVIKKMSLKKRKC